MSSLVHQSEAIPAESKSSQYLTFLLGAEEYGVSILRVQEIRGWQPPTPIPSSAEYVRGVINLRGEVIPIVDLRQRFNKDHAAYTKNTVVIVVKVKSKNAERTVGLVVDAVSEVRDVDDLNFRPAPELCAERRTFVKGLATVGNGMIILLDIDGLGDLSAANN